MADTYRVTAPAVYIRDTGTAKGRGVFAARAFHQGEIVEICPVVLINSKWETFPDDLKKLVFAWEFLTTQKAGIQAIALGYGCLYNHSDPANMRYVAEANKLEMHFIAVRDVHAGEELTVNYSAIGGGAKGPDNKWFERMGVKPI